MTNTDNLTIGQAEIYFREGIDSPLVGYWSFDEGSGTTITDQSGNGNDGTLYGSPTWTTGISGYALSFTAVEDHVNIDNQLSPNPTTEITVSAWVYSSGSSSGYSRLASQYWAQASSTGWMLAINSSNEAFFGISVDTIQYQAYTADTLSSGWHHMVGVYDGSEVRVYLDGVVGSNTANLVGASFTSGYAPQFASAHADSIDLDEVRIYNRALSTTEIQALYSNPNGKLISASMPDTQSLGNIVTSGINVDTTYAEHYKRVKGKRVKDEEFVITNGININFTFDEIKRENIQKFLLGKEADTSASRIKVMLENGIRGRAILKFNTDVGNSLLYAIPKCVLKSDGGLNLTSDKWVEGNFKIDVLYHDTYRIGDDTSASKAPFGYVDVNATIFGSPF